MRHVFSISIWAASPFEGGGPVSSRTFSLSSWPTCKTKVRLFKPIKRNARSALQIRMVVTTCKAPTCGLPQSVENRKARNAALSKRMAYPGVPGGMDSQLQKRTRAWALEAAGLLPKCSRGSLSAPDCSGAGPSPWPFSGCTILLAIVGVTSNRPLGIYSTR